jgi:acetyl esterase/lipase
VSQNISIIRDLTYAVAGGDALQADLYLPDTTTPPPTVVYIHGGGWAVGSRRDHCDTRLPAIAKAGLAVLSIDYRLIDKAHFPAQVHDAKAAVRWIKANSGELGVDAERVGVWGASAGAVLAALVGLTAGQPDWEGNDTKNTEFTSDVHAVVFWFGISDFTATTSRSALESQLVPDGPEAAFLGLGSAAEIVDQSELARRASPVSWAHAAAPPFLIAHGDRDRIVPQTESFALHAALTRVGAESTLVSIGGAGHEGEAFDSAANIAVTAGFLGATLKHATHAA